MFLYISRDLLKQNNMKLSKGFTMIEIVIALFVLTVAVIGVYNAFSIMAVATTQMSDRFTAAYLAQEGIEIVRNIRDNNWLQADQNSDITWDRGLTSCDTGCEADYKTEAFSGAGYVGNVLKLGGGFYNYSSGVDTKFKRKIVIDPVKNDANETIALKVAVTVFWAEKPTIVNIDFPASSGSITAEDYLYNWYK